MTIDGQLEALKPLRELLVDPGCTADSWKLLLTCYDHQMLLDNMAGKAIRRLTAWCDANDAEWGLDFIGGSLVSIHVVTSERVVYEGDCPSLAHALAAAVKAVEEKHEHESENERHRRVVGYPLEKEMGE